MNFALRQSGELPERLGQALVDDTASVPPITYVGLEDVPALFGSQGRLNPDGKTVIIL